MQKRPAFVETLHMERNQKEIRLELGGDHCIMVSSSQGYGKPDEVLCVAKYPGGKSQQQVL